MSIEPQINLQFTDGQSMSLQTYALLKSFYDALPENTNAFTMKSPDGNAWRITVSNAGALVVTAA